MEKKDTLIGIVGGGNGGLELYQLFEENEKFKLAFVCDKSEEAPLMRLAKARGVQAITDLDIALQKEVDFVLEATGSEKVVQILKEKLATSKAQLVDHRVAHLFFDMLQSYFGNEDDTDTQKDKFLTFKLGAEDYGIAITHVTEIIGVQKITDVPDMPDFVKGVINLRGKVIPVIDVRTRFKMDTCKYDDRTCVIVVKINEMDLGLVVDTVKEVTDIPEGQISPPPKIQSEGSHKFVQGLGRVEQEVKILLDVNKLLQEGEFQQLKTN